MFFDFMIILLELWSYYFGSIASYFFIGLLSYLIPVKSGISLDVMADLEGEGLMGKRWPACAGEDCKKLQFVER